MRHVKQLPSYKHQPPQSAAAIPIGHVDADGVDLTSKTVVVTGANSGLGKQVTTYVAAKGAKVYMLCRNAERAAQAKEDIWKQIQSYQPKSSLSADNLQIVVVDVAELEQVRAAAKELQSKEPAGIHALVCNAGVLLNERQDSSEGREATFASHLLGGTYLLSQLLLPQLEAAHGRVVIVTSGGMYSTNLPSWDILTSTSSDQRKYSGIDAYAYAKRAQVLLAERWAREIPSVEWVTVHPGWANTPAVTTGLSNTKKYLEPLRDPWQGAEGVAWLVATDSQNIVTGELYLDRKVQPKHLAGPFFSEGKFTKNTEEDVDDLLTNLKKEAGL